MVKIVVVGSANIDLTIEVDRWPQPGETVFGNSLHFAPGGKGANQAVAAARLGAAVTFVACVGEDAYANDVINNLKANAVFTDYVYKLVGEVTGTAHITLAENDNSIIVIKGANDKMTESIIDLAISAIKEADIVMVQQEIPLNAVTYLVTLCHNLGVPVLLNPAPIQNTSQDTLNQATFLTPNEHEVLALFSNKNIDSMLKLYPNKLIITEGAEGAYYNDGKSIQKIPTFPVKVIDTTGAGDTFNAAFAVAIAEKQSMANSIRFANAAAAISVQSLGAQAGMPKREAVERLLRNE